jgi:hypothetical protein
MVAFLICTAKLRFQWNVSKLAAPHVLAPSRRPRDEAFQDASLQFCLPTNYNVTLQHELLHERESRKY